MTPATIARIELPVMNLRYLGRADWMNSALEAGDIFESEGIITETNSAAPPIQATIAPIWRTNRTRNVGSAAICWNRYGVEEFWLLWYATRISIVPFSVENLQWLETASRAGRRQAFFC